MILCGALFVCIDEDALGEYTGVKPDEFMTLDKKAMVNSGQIMYDTLNNSTLARGNMCSTLDRLDRQKNKPQVSVDTSYSGPVDYNTGKNSHRVL